MYTVEQFAKMIDQSLVRPDANKSDVLRLVEQAAERHFASIVVFPCWVGTVANELHDSDVKVGTVISFPFGGDSRASKVYSIKNAISNGANEIDALFNISKFKGGDLDGVRRDLNEMVEAVHQSSGSLSAGLRRVLLKIVIETCYLTPNEIECASRLVRDANADFVQTSTGCGPSGAKVEDIRLIRRAVGAGSLGVKAAGGVKTVEEALSMLDAGANRIGTSVGVHLVDSYEPHQYEK